MLQESGGDYNEVVEYLHVTFPNVKRGISLRSLKRYCQQENIRVPVRIYTDGRGSDGKFVRRTAKGRPKTPQQLKHAEVSVDDSEEEGEGEQELPESQEPGADTEEGSEVSERDKKTSSGSSTSESLKPLSARTEGNLTNLEDVGKGKGGVVQVDGEDVFTEDGLLDQREINADDEVVPVKRESPESAHALPVDKLISSSGARKRPSSISRVVSTPVHVTTTDNPPLHLQRTMVLQDGSMLSSPKELLSLVRSLQTENSVLRQQLRQLTHYIHVYQADQKQKTASVMHDEQLVKEMVSTRLGSTLTEFSNDESQLPENAIHEHHQSTLSQTLATTLSGHSGKAVKVNVKSAVVPSVQNIAGSQKQEPDSSPVSSPHAGSIENRTSPTLSGFEPFVSVIKTETQAAAYSLLNTGEENGSRRKGRRSGSPDSTKKDDKVAEDTKKEGAVAKCFVFTPVTTTTTIPPRQVQVIVESLEELLSLVKSKKTEISGLRQQLNIYQADKEQEMTSLMHEKLTAANTVLKESIAMMVKSKGVVDAIGGAAAGALQGPIQVTYREAFQSTIMPSFERACQNMFQQINESFHKGTHQYLHQVTTALDNYTKEEEIYLEPVMQQLETQIQSFQADFEVTLQKQLLSSTENLREDILSLLLTEVLASVQDAVQQIKGLDLEILRHQLSEMIASSTETTSPQAPDTARTQAIVSRLLESGQFAEAFQEALTAADQSVVMYVCENADAENVLSQSPCPLSQPVLLSLIQQLSVDFTINTALKHKYIEQALIALDVCDEDTTEQMSAVLEELCQQLQSAIQEVSSPMKRSLKVLQIAARTFLR
ncbi:hypothetical protein ACROYT_G013213 [Oculina patagonica]